MTYQEAREYLEVANQYGSVLGLDNIRELLRRLGNPQDDLKYIHIAGTNGKGSVLAYVSTVLMEAGYQVGRYISPTLFSYRERIQVNEVYITKEELAKQVEEIAKVIQDMMKEGLPHPTPFEIETALAFLHFKENNCDIVVLETGLGGLLDATNVIKTTIMAILTSISMDHMGYLGTTLGEVAYHKAGIIKPGITVISAEQEPEAGKIIEEKSIQEGAKLFIAQSSLATDIHYGIKEQTLSYGNYENIKIHLAGNYQIKNAVIALEAFTELNHLGYEITQSQVKRGMARTKWRGRFSIVREEPMVIIDGAHNEAAAMTLRESILQNFNGKNLYYIMGTFADKEYVKVAQLTAPLATSIITIETPNNPRALPAQELAKAVRPYNANVKASASIEEAVRESLAMAAKQDVIIAFGSLSFLGEIVQYMEGDESL